MVGEGVYYMHAIFGRLLYIGVLVYGLVVNNYGIVKTLKGIGSVYKRHPVTKFEHGIHGATG